MNRARSVLLHRNFTLWHGARVGALHPGGWAGRLRLLLDRLFVLRFFVLRRLVASLLARARHRRRRHRVRLGHGAERIGLPDQPRQLGERIAAAGVMLIAAAIIIVGGERVALID